MGTQLPLAGTRQEAAAAPLSDLPRARVIVERPIGPLDYSIPDNLSECIEPGSPVQVPLGNRLVAGYVVDLPEGPAPPEITLKPIADLDGDKPQLPGSLLRLVLFAADYYAAPAGDVLAAALPSNARRASSRYVLTEQGTRALDTSVGRDDRALLEAAAKHPKGFSVVAIERACSWSRRQASERLRRQVSRGWLEKLQGRRHQARKVVAFRRTDLSEEGLLSTRQKSTRELLANIPRDSTVQAAELAKLDPGAYRKLKTLQKLQLVERVIEHREVRPAAEPELIDLHPTPTIAQTAAIDTVKAALDAECFAAFLLHGVTGSGKTEVYLQLIEGVLAQGKTALILVPEIALTPQLGARFRSRFGDRVATFHSGLTTAERRDEWERIASRRAVIGLGARSAIFLPLRNLGIIVVDEEHETSFKQDESPRYNARDLAVVRAQRGNAVVLLGSATPSLETRGNANQGRYQLLSLPQRVEERPMPEVEIVDLAKAERVADGIFTVPLVQALEQTLSADEQAILFLNRRGFAPYVYCRDCGAAFRCDDCDVALTFHRRRDLLMCHYCGFEAMLPETCPACAGFQIDAHGLGTERLESELREIVGDIPIARLDRDTVKRRTDIDRELSKFRSGEARILIGTQMVAKGHDFPNVTLVGVMAADGSLNFPDFRAAERTFQLLTQVAGRSGRGDKIGRVLVQAYEVDHYAVQAAARHDYEAFVEQELAYREELDYPPFSHLALLRFEGHSEGATHEAAQRAATALASVARQSGDASVLGPAPAPLSRLRGVWRMQVLLKGSTRAGLRRVLCAPQALRASRDVRVVLDVDPINML